MNIGQNIGSANKLGVFITIILSLFFINITKSNAQQPFWSKQEKIPEYEIENYEQPPYLIADQNHVVHAFNSQSLILDDDNSPRAIFYRQWTLENGWTYPNDVLFDETGGDIELVGVSSDQAGMVHLVYQKNFDDLYYSNAYLADAGNPFAWSVPVFIDGGSLHIRPGIPNVGAIANDNTSGQIVIVFSGAQYGNGLYYTLSTDTGDNWTDPYPIYLTGSGNLIVSDPKLYVGESGFLHGVWATKKDDGFGGPAFYANYDLLNGAWNDPIEIDVPGIRTPSVFDYGGDVLINYHHIISNSNWIRRSSDLGTTWSLPTQISSRHVGTNGSASFVVDSDNNMYVFFAQRINPNDQGVWYAIWNKGRWSGVESVVHGPERSDVVGGNGFGPNSARAVVLNGNVILVAWGTDGAMGQNGAWYSYKILDTPELPAVALPLPELGDENAQMPSQNSVIEASETPENAVTLLDADQIKIRNPITSIYLAAGVVVLVLGGFMVLRAIDQTKNK